MTIYDIAEEAGVSTATVSRVINGSDRVSEKTRKRVEAVMANHHFLANSSAQSLVRKRTNSIGIVVPDLHNIHYLDAAEVIVSFFEKNGMTCILNAAGEEPERHVRVLRMIAERQVDGLVLVSSFFKSDEVATAIKRYFPDVPVLMFYSHLDLENVISVGVDEEAAAREATELLLKKGHSHLVFVKLGESSSIRHKFDGFIAVCRANEGARGRMWSINAKDYEGIKASVHAMLNTYPDTDGIVFSNDYLAMAGGAAITATGRKVPEDIAYISFYNCGHAYMATPQISSVDTRICDLAQIGCNLMLEAFDKAEPNMRASLPYRIVERETT